MNGYIKVSDAAEKWEIGARVIPEDVEKLKDARIKSGKYIKKKGE